MKIRINALKKGGSFIFDIDSMYKMETILKDYDEENDLCDNPYIQKTQWGWPIDTKGLRYTLNWLYDRYQLPMFIVEMVLVQSIKKKLMVQFMINIVLII